MNEPDPWLCSCATLSDLAAVPMGGNGLDERVFATLKPICDHGGDRWWLYLSECSACAQHWMIAQDERIFDEYFLRRVNAEDVVSILQGQWPDDFITYQRVLEIGHTFTKPCVFIDPMSPSLVQTAHDLRKECPGIVVSEVARLLGVTTNIASRLLSAGLFPPSR